MNISTFEVEGWVNEVNRTKWGVDIVLRLMDDESTAKFPQRMLISASKKNEGKVPTTLGVGDRVNIQFAPFLNEGVNQSTQKIYKVNRNMLMAMTVLESADGKPPAEAAEDDTPF